jgi:hypothetical protein
VPAGAAAASAASSSGVRGTASDAPQPLEDFREDAPQFFDRKLLRSLEAPPPSSGPSEPPKDQTPDSLTGVLQEGAPPSRAGAARPAPWVRWAGYALVALGLATAALFALR